MRKALLHLMRTKPLSRALKPEEQKLFETLVAVNETYQLNAVLRVAGGWVRDAFLGKQSHDIDIAVDGPAPPNGAAPFMTGVVFAEYVDKYHKEHGDGSRTSFGVIKANPDQSKHLETATAKVCGFDIDFVNLRKEDYADGSRIPTVTRATPKEDAERRDLTINALFYNLQTQLAEDFTEKGFEDLDNGYIRTPLVPVETFRDDPLRLLRCIRFACRFGFQIDPAIIAAAQRPEVQADLTKKVSRDRMGIEVRKMMGGPRPHNAAELLHRCGVRDIVFTSQMYNKKQLPEGEPKHVGWQSNAATDDPKSYPFALAMVEKLAHPVFIGEEDEEVRMATVFAALFLGVAPPFDRSAPSSLLPGQYAAPVFHWVESILTHSLKSPARVAHSVSRLIVGAMDWWPIMTQALAFGARGADASDLSVFRDEWQRFLAPDGNVNSGRVKACEWIRFTGATLWRAAILLSVFAVRIQPAICQPVIVPVFPDAFISALLESMASNGLPGVIELKPLIRGDELQAHLKLPKGPSVSIASAYLLRLQMAAPELTMEQLLTRITASADDITAATEHYAAQKRTKRE